MTDEQYTEFTRLAGQTANHLVQLLPDLNVEHPTEVDLDLVTKSLSLARTEAKRLLVAEWAGGKPAPSPVDLMAKVFKDWKAGVIKARKPKRARRQPGEAFEDYQARRDAYQKSAKRAREAFERFTP